MNNVKAIRDRLGLTQAALAQGLGCTQGNVWHYEQGQTIPPDAAKRLIDYAATLGYTITFNDVYGEEGVFEAVPMDASQLLQAAKAPLTTDEILATDLKRAEQAGIVKLSHPDEPPGEPRPAGPWDGKTFTRASDAPADGGVKKISSYPERRRPHDKKGG